MSVDLLTELLKWLSGPLILVAVGIWAGPDLIEKWIALFWRLLSFLGSIFRGARKRYVKHDLQSRVNLFTKRMRKQAPFLDVDGVKLEWVDEALTPEAIIEKNKVIVRVNHQEPDDHNFVQAAYLYVSKCLLLRVKRYLSPSQRESIDLYTLSTLLEDEKPAAVDWFLGEYLHPRTEDPEGPVAVLIDKYARFNRSGLYYPIYLQELRYLGMKVFGGRQDDRIISEVNALVDHLTRLADRTVGSEDVPLSFMRTYCRFALVIIGRWFNITPEGGAWTAYVKNNVIPANIETLYLLGRVENRETIDAVAESIAEWFDTARTTGGRATLRYPDGGAQDVEHHVVILRKKGIPIVQPSDPVT